MRHLLCPTDGGERDRVGVRRGGPDSLFVMIGVSRGRAWRPPRSMRSCTATMGTRGGVAAIRTGR